MIYLKYFIIKFSLIFFPMILNKNNEKKKFENTPKWQYQLVDISFLLIFFFNCKTEDYFLIFFRLFIFFRWLFICHHTRYLLDSSSVQYVWTIKRNNKVERKKWDGKNRVKIFEKKKKNWLCLTAILQFFILHLGLFEYIWIMKKINDE